MRLLAPRLSPQAGSAGRTEPTPSLWLSDWARRACPASEPPNKPSNAMPSLSRTVLCCAVTAAAVLSWARGILLHRGRFAPREHTSQTCLGVCATEGKQRFVTGRSNGQRNPVSWGTSPRDGLEGPLEAAHWAWPGWGCATAVVSSQWRAAPLLNPARCNTLHHPEAPPPRRAAAAKCGI